MDIEKYRVLLSTIEAGSLSQAAINLGYTPSGISRIINALEVETGFSLLIRNKSGVLPTSDCQNILPAIKQLLQSSENLAQLSAQVTGKEIGTITIGSSYGIYYRWLSKVIYDFSLEHPNINFNIVEGPSSALCEMVENGQADFCIISKREGHFNWIPLHKDELVVWVPQNHPSIKQGYFHLADLGKEKFVKLYPGKITDNSLFLKSMHIVPNTKYSTSDMYAAYSMVEAGLGIALTNKLLADNMHGSAASVPLKPSQLIDIGIATPDSQSISPATKTFVKFVMGQLKASNGEITK